MPALREIKPADVEAVREVRAQAAEELTRRHGRGRWSTVSALRTLRKHADEGRLYGADDGGELIATFTLSEKKIAFYRKSWFAHPDDPALYLTNMAVRPENQRKGLGRWSMKQIESIGRSRGLRAVRFDSYIGPAGAGPFYRKCGYTLVHAGPLDLEYYEKILPR